MQQLKNWLYWIAAHALQANCPLISTDKDFENIPELSLNLLSTSGQR